MRWSRVTGSNHLSIGCCFYLQYFKRRIATYVKHFFDMSIDYGQLILLAAKYLVTLEIIIKRTITLSTANAIRKEYGNQTPIIL